MAMSTSRRCGRSRPNSAGPRGAELAPRDGRPGVLQQAADDVAGVVVVVDEEDAEPVELGHGSTHYGRPRSGAAGVQSLIVSPRTERDVRLRNLTLKTKLLLMMLSLLVLSVSTLFLLHLYDQQRLLSQLRDYTEDLSTAIEVAPGAAGGAKATSRWS